MTEENEKRMIEAQQSLENVREIQRLKNKYGNPDWVYYYLGIENLSKEEKEEQFDEMLEGF